MHHPPINSEYVAGREHSPTSATKSPDRSLPSTRNQRVLSVRDCTGSSLEIMLKLTIMFCFLATALAAPSIALTGTLSKREIQTPASTSKLTPIVGPIVAPIAHIPLTRAQILPQVSPYAYSYPGQIAPIAYVPSGYSIEQHGYNIAY